MFEAQVDAIRDDLCDLKEQHRETSATVSAMAPRVKRIDHELFGNGRPGLIVQMAKMQQQVRMGIWLAASIGTASLTALVGIFLKIVA